MRLTIEPIAFATANTFVAHHHRHSKPEVGHLYSLGAWADVLDLRVVAGKLHLTRKSNHPSGPKCPGCVEDRGPCPQCGHSTHPSLPPCEHHPERADYEQRVKKLARFLPSTRETGGES